MVSRFGGEGNVGDPGGGESGGIGSDGAFDRPPPTSADSDDIGGGGLNGGDPINLCITSDSGGNVFLGSSSPASTDGGDNVGDANEEAGRVAASRARVAASARAPRGGGVVAGIEPSSFRLISSLPRWHQSRT